MSLTKPPSTPGTPEEKKLAAHKARPPLQKRLLQVFGITVLVIVIFTSWQLLNKSSNSTDPAAAGRPLSNPHTHLHTVAMGGRPGVLYLGTHFGLFTSTDGGRTWPQARGVLDTMMITAIAVSPSNPDVLAIIAIPTSGIGGQSGVYFSHDGGSSWHASAPPGLSISAYPFTVKAGSANAAHFYAFYNYAGWFETRDGGTHWYAITSGTLSNMQTPSLLTDPTDPNHLILGGDQGLYESRDDGQHWNHISAVRGSVWSIAAANTSARRISCATDQGLYYWRDGSTSITQVMNLPMASPPARLVTSATGDAIYGVSGQDLWYSADNGITWEHRWHFDRGDMVSLVVDPLNPHHLYAGFFLPAILMDSTNGGSSWQTLTN
jgi:photosystem II stability/assembly factor-like uncharacterized protein